MANIDESRGKITELEARGNDELWAEMGHDGQIQSAAQEILASHDHLDVEIDVNNGVLSLFGEVSGRKTKHKIEHLLQDIPGIKHIENQLKIKRVEKFHHRRVGPPDEGGVVWPGGEGLKE